MEFVIPPNLFERAKRLAQRQERPVRDVVAEALERGLPLVEEPDDSVDLEREAQAFRRMHGQLLADHAGEYVAVYQGELVDHDMVFAELLERIESRYPNELVLIRPVQKEPEIVYEHCGVRWAGSQ